MPMITVTGPNIPCEIHRAGCADLKKARLRGLEEHWTLEVTNWHDLATEIWGDPAGDTLEVGSQEWHDTCDEWLAGEYRTMPCVPSIPAKA